MQNHRNKLFAGGAVLILAASGTVMNRQAARAQGGPTVTIGAPIPLPVTGTVAVTGNVATTGTVAATQSGSWSVGIIGTPTVNVNPSGTAQPGRSIDEPGRVPYQAFVEAGPSDIPVVPAVPAGKRLVIDHLSAFASLTAAGNTAFILAPNNTGAIGQNEFKLVGRADPQEGTSNTIVSFSGLIRAYADAGFVPAVSVDASSNLVNFFDATLSGYLIDCSSQNTPCAPIAP